MTLATLSRFDCETLEWMSRRRSRRLIKLTRAISFSGNARTVALAFAGALWLWPGETTLRAGVATLIGLCVFFLLKRFVRRARPVGAAIAAPDPFSLPSGHATCAWAIALSLAHAAPLLAALAMLWAIAVSLSRVILGVHYPLDVVAGGVIGSLAALAAALWM
jgi:undecaprenyl-diphosphatase